MEHRALLHEQHAGEENNLQRCALHAYRAHGER